jgi:hypothetical protein
MVPTAAGEESQQRVVEGDTWLATGTVSVEMFIVVGKLTVKLKFPDGKKKKFVAWIYGGGMGKGKAAGGGPWKNNYVPDDGHMHYEISAVVYTAGQLEIVFTKDKKVVGSFVGPAIGGAGLIGAGKGKWHND